MRNAGMPKSDNNTKHGRSLSEEYKDKGFVRLRNREKLADVDSHSVPSRRGEQLWKDAEYTDDEEFIDLRYTACMSKKPINFTPDGYRLRCFEKNYRIKMFLVVTMYNEEDTEMERTMRGVNENLQHLVQSEGKEMWQRYLCCIVSDGRTKANPNTLNYMASLGFYDGDLIRKPSANFDVRLHMFEFTAQFREDDNFEAFFPPLQIIFALKEHNGGKLDSHMWYFNAFADQIRPTYCILIDVGTQPRRRAIYKLYRAMETNRRIAGVCGEIAAYKPNYINPVVAAQVFEYKISHILDKSLESTYGFITVLPGAFSAYRFEAIAEEDGKGPLVEYFKSSTTSMREMGAFKANMYLAEDRILCFEIIARKNHNWLLYYVKNAVAETDVPETLDILIRQRRRWLNGSFFALLYALLNFSRFYNDSSHGIGRKLVISTQFAYLAMNVFLNWILLANFYLAFNALVTSSSFIGSPESSRYETFKIIGDILSLIYFLLIMVNVVIGLGNIPQEMKHVYGFCSLFFGLFNYMVAFLSILYVFASDQEGDALFGLSWTVIQIASMTVFAVYFLGSLAHGELFPILLSFFQYLYMLPTFINIFTIYSFCNTHDISWGNRESGGDAHGKKDDGGGMENKVQDKTDPAQLEANNKQDLLIAKRALREKANAGQEKKMIDAEFKSFRTSMLIAWLASNYIFIFIIESVITDPTFYLKFLIMVMIYFMGVRFIGSILFLIQRASWLGYRKWLKSADQSMNKRSARNHKSAAKHTGVRSRGPSRRTGGGGRGARGNGGRGAAGGASSYTPPAVSTDKCPSCSQPIFADSKFCTSCGTKCTV